MTTAEKRIIEKELRLLLARFFDAPRVTRDYFISQLWLEVSGTQLLNDMQQDLEE